MKKKNQNNRREFLKRSGIVAGGLVLGCSCFYGCANLQKSEGKKGKTMGKIIAYCGGRCDTCTIFLATREDNDEKKHKMRVEIAREIKKLYGEDCKPEDVTDCDGCKAEGGRLNSGCSNCQVRKCAMERGVETCAHCDEYICKKLEEFFLKEPSGKEALEEIRKNL